MAILTPIAVPLAFDSSGDVALVSMAIGAIFSGAIFGDHCSPISDTTVMVSIFAGSDHIDHVRTQIPYALVPASAGCCMGVAGGRAGGAVWRVDGAGAVGAALMRKVNRLEVLKQLCE